MVRKTARSTGAKLWSGSRVPSIELFVRSTPRNALMFASGLRVPVTVTQRKRIGLGLGLRGWGVGGSWGYSWVGVGLGLGVRMRMRMRTTEG